MKRLFSITNPVALLFLVAVAIVLVVVFHGFDTRTAYSAEAASHVAHGLPFGFVVVDQSVYCSGFPCRLESYALDSALVAFLWAPFLLNVVVVFGILYVAINLLKTLVNWVGSRLGQQRAV